MLCRKNFHLLVILTALIGCPISAKAQAERKPGEVVEVEIAKGVKMKFCWIPEGEAQLGSPKAERQEFLRIIKEKEEPDHIKAEAEEVRGVYKSKGFWMAKYPVTQAEWSAVMGKKPSFFVPTQEDMMKARIADTSRFPVEQVSLEESQAMAEKLNKLPKISAMLGKGRFCVPHEDEWEYAARGGKGNKQAFYFGNELNGKQANCIGGYPFGTDTKGPYLGRPSVVGTYEKVAPHPWGLCDMTGNIFQWCENTYDGNANSLVLRGGGWESWAMHCRSAYRFQVFGPNCRGNRFGCRLCFRME